MSPAERDHPGFLVLVVKSFQEVLKMAHKIENAVQFVRVLTLLP